ncbi:MAG: hypothetical protein K8T91_15085 [Planctomycetes bacterium]|nr:hypothetical protein [Planctomycetota bacterium]
MTKKRTIPLDAFGIKITLAGNQGTIRSDLERQVCPFCGLPDCCYHCDEAAAGGFGKEAEKIAESEAEIVDRLKFNGALDAVESLVLARACAGIDVNSPAYLEGIETAINALGNEFS